MHRHPRVLTRAAVFYGDRFSDACIAFRISGADLDAARVISTGTTTKLNRRYRGAPVENATRDRIVDFFRTKLSPEIQERLNAKGLDLEQILLPATFRLTDQACVLYGRIGKAYRPGGLLKADQIYDQSVQLMMRGAYGVRKHVILVADYILENSRPFLDQGIAHSTDLIEEMPDHNACHPSIYRTEPRQREAQLTLLPGGRS